MKPFRDFFTGGFARPAIVAHRGDWSAAPENSLKAIRAAADLGCEIAEIDVQRSADGVFFVLHDRSLARTSTRPEVAETLDWKTLSALHLREGDGSGPPTDQTLPSLAQVLETARGRIYLDVDVKDPAHMDQVAALISAEGMAEQVNIKIDVQTPADARTLKTLEDDHGVLVMPKTRFREATADALIDLLASCGAPVVEAKFDSLPVIANRREAFAAAGLKLSVYTLNGIACCDLSDDRARENPDAIWGVLLDAGVSVLMTDALVELKAYRAQRPGSV